MLSKHNSPQRSDAAYSSAGTRDSRDSSQANALLGGINTFRASVPIVIACVSEFEIC